MKHAEVLQRILDVGVIPVIRASSDDEAFFAAEAVAQGGIPIAEITMTVPGALEVIQSLVKTRPDLLVGAGTVLDLSTARRCLEAGAEFLASPGLDLETVRLARSQAKVAFAGALTPTEVIAAWKAGADLIKVFPCNAVGGARYLASLKGPLPQVRLVPSGGVSLDSAADFIRAGAAALAAGGELVETAALRSRKVAVIADNARKLVELVRAAREQVALPHSRLGNA